ncbi:gluconokinase [Virgibacillus sediminis]|uniref:Gluconokinase n=1 Tax=Virgibacillus sediminis TaxID=202260 RepID=A0ABV7A4K9_9BACI
MARELVIGLDLGTTSVKAVLFDMAGSLIAEAEQMIETLHPQPGWAEQDPVQIEASCRQALKEVTDEAEVQEGELVSIGISAAMHSLICLDEDDRPLSNMLIWSDGRSSAQAEKLMHTKGMDIYSRTGTPIHPMSPLNKLLWMKENEFDGYQQAASYMSMKEYLLKKWYGERVIDYSMASATGMYNLESHTWDKEALEVAGIRKEQLSQIVAPTYVLRGMDQHIAEEIGIPATTPLVIGAADGQLANLGNGSILPGEVNVSVGTSGAIRQFIRGGKVNEKHETFTYAFTEDTSIIGGPTNNGGIALQWLKDLLDFQGTHDELTSLAETVSPGADGIIFLPYVNGERAPLWNQHAKGNFYGLNIRHRKEQLVRAVLEGITFNIYQIGKSLEEIAGEPKKISVNGGLTKSSLWVQIMADVFGQEIYLSDTHHNAAWGAAWTALVGVGRVESFEAIKENLPSEKAVEPNMENHQKYMKIYEKYEKIAEDVAIHFV